MSKDELIELIHALKKRKKFGLVWEDKPEQIVKDFETKLPFLEQVPSKQLGNDSGKPTNLILEGDNFHSLSVLNYTHAGKVDVIYIDPPYNTGTKDFVYNDSYVDRDDVFRHSKWLSFMEKRLRLAKSLLKTTGAIFISIDQNELANLKLLCDEVLSGMVMSGLVSVAKGTTTGQDAKKFGSSIDYLLVYVGQDFQLQSLPLTEDDQKRFSLEDDRGRYSILQWRKTGKNDRREDRPNLYHGLQAPDGSEVFPIGPTGYESCWRGSRTTFIELEKQDMVVWKQTADGYRPYVKYYLEGRGKAPSTLWTDIEGNKKATIELKNIIGGGKFDNPKPTELIRRCLNIATADKDALVLDFFAGSGTTGHAVLQLNAEDGGNRSFILCTNNENGIAENVTYERIKGVISGYDKVPGIEANLRYFKTMLVSKQRTDDETRFAVVEKCAELICIRENSFKEVSKSQQYSIYESAEAYVGIVLETFDTSDAISTLNALPADKPLNLYVFSLSNDDYASDFLGLNKPFNIKPIPESILEVYRRITRETEKSVGE